MDRAGLKRITVDPRVMVGKLVIRGTRVPVALILKMLGQGIPVEEILQVSPSAQPRLSPTISGTITPLPGRIVSKSSTLMVSRSCLPGFRPVQRMWKYSPSAGCGVVIKSNGGGSWPT